MTFLAMRMCALACECVVEGELGAVGGGDTHQMVDDKLVLNYLLHLCAKDFCLSSFLID